MGETARYPTLPELADSEKQSLLARGRLSYPTSTLDNIFTTELLT